jgi:uncharacterized RDD family membrane protein YckC
MAFCAKCGKELPQGATFCPSCGAPVGSPASAASTAPVSGIDEVIKDSKAQEYWIRRLIALIVDVVIIAVVVAIVAAIGFGSTLLSGGVLGTVFFGAFAIIAGVIIILYFPVMESTRGASIGKQILKLKVVSKTGGNPTFGEAFVRNVSKIYWLLLLLDVVVGLAVSKGYQQKYSDKLMGTSVVRS